MPPFSNTVEIHPDQVTVGDVIQVKNTNYPNRWFTVTHVGVDRLLATNSQTGKETALHKADAYMYVRQVPGDPCTKTTPAEPEKYVPQVGDRVCLPNWRNESIEVLYVGKDVFLGRSSKGTEYTYLLRDRWQKVTPPLTIQEVWITCYANAHGTCYTDLDRAMGGKTGRCQAIVHIKSDGTSEIAWEAPR